jgi:crotonobetainyl-CoA:carnitine CoA-transferase CaiB-like acyl-CoA transferase
MAASMGPALLEAELGEGTTGCFRTAEQPNRHSRMVPHGVYPTSGEDRWLALAVRGDAEWRLLAGHTGVPELAALASLGPADRRAHEDEIDAALAAWCSGRDGATLAAELQALGIAAAVVATGRDLVAADEHLAARGFYPVLEHAIAGPVRHEGIVVRMSATPGTLTAPAPLLGEHTDAVLKGLLGMDEEELSLLRDAGALE